MNLFTIGKTTDGRMQVTFSKTPEAMDITRPVMEYLFSLSVGAELPNGLFKPVLLEPSNQRSETTEARTKKRGRPRKEEEVDVLKAKKKAEEKKYNRMSAMERKWYDELLQIRELVMEYVFQISGRRDKKLYSSSYTDFYSEIFKESGYAPSARTTLRALGIYQPSLLNTLITDNKGHLLVTCVNRKLRQLSIRAV